ncbi:MAG: acyltransferase family protein [bacterium]
MKTRVFFLDNLRTFMIFLVVVIHSGLVYESVLEYSWIVSDPDKANGIGLIRMYLDIIVMFTLFFISGYFIPRSVGKKSSWDFLRSKFKRIMVPWLVAVFTLIPAYKAIFLYARGLPQEAWYTYFHLFERSGGNMFYFADNPVQNWLWFLPVLFLFQVIYLLLYRANLLSFKLSMKTGIVLTFLIGLAYSLLIFGLDLRGWYHSPLLHFQNDRLLIYFMVFLLGSLTYKLNIFESGRKNKKQYIWVNVALTLSLTVFTGTALNLFFNLVDPARNFYFISPFADRVVYYGSMLLSMLSLLYVLLYAFRFSLNKTSWWMEELNTNSYSVYIIHVVVIGLIALPLLHFSIPAFVKFLILTLSAYLASNLLISGYRRTIRKLFNKPLFPKLALPAALLLTIAFYVVKDSKAVDKMKPSTQEVVQTTPDVGLHMAVIQNNLQAIRQHIATGSDLNAREPSGGSSPLITAAVLGKTEAALMLMDAGAEVNLKNFEGSTALHSAAFFCHTDIVRALLDHGADPALRNNAGSTPLESVEAPFEAVEGIYDYFEKTLGPLGLELDYEYLRSERPVIANILRKATEE